MYGQYSRAVCNKERVIVARVQYIDNYLRNECLLCQNGLFTIIFLGQLVWVGRRTFFTISVWFRQKNNSPVYPLHLNQTIFVLYSLISQSESEQELKYCHCNEHVELQIYQAACLDLVRSGRPHPANLGVRPCPGWTLICPVRLSPTGRAVCPLWFCAMHIDRQTTFTVVKLSGLVCVVWVNTMCACFLVCYAAKRPQCVVVCERAKVI